ncbi:hypothetical protein G6F46_005778 [Rhizopus delemar]|uniref:Uncharacterized protein n=2 Tax=Rhizopus TaxID=4842 RepID=A0A9P6Z3G8_9FUNG|nr:hypothetical protein G6F55_005085 [Rhizopus delemar]KAG1544074.1 hypothetical protein G6F51_006286 [Rhizopus arrhizus]KAG1497917.1 hypothetical protein G6F54_005439 [Rhizopus delemar]KAG1516003.1 hypothetical protein G6F53_002494 [Rhizopus delemar]KAG1525303.1 hypothetical protein G6F52_003446 [Rhizopus delemar]
MTSSSTSTNGSQQTNKVNKRSDHKNNTNKIQPSFNHDSRPTTPILMNNSSHPIMNRLSSMTGRSPPSTHSTPSPADQYINYHQSNSFFLPKDWESRNYEENLHYALKTTFGGTVSQTVLPRLQKGARVIQMGSCTNPWLMDMATQFPFCHFTGIEVVPNSFLQDFPPLPNVAFERGLPWIQILQNLDDNSIDYIHLRACSSFLDSDQWHQGLTEMYRILKPEGVIRMEDFHNLASGTVMIESFVETCKLRNIAASSRFDFDIAPKLGNIATQHHFQIIESKKKRIHYGSKGKVEEEFLLFILGIFEQVSDQMAPLLGLEPEDYKHRVEMFCAQCVKNDCHMDWFSWVVKKPAST